jgi:PAS domain S-box-containing protein
MGGGGQQSILARPPERTGATGACSCGLRVLTHGADIQAYGAGADAGAGASADFLARGGEMGRLMRRHDWSRTSLGPIERWPQSLKTAVGMILPSPMPIVMLWGEDGIMIYNDAYSSFAGGRHPALLGSKVREGWPEVADFNDHVMKVCLAGGTLAYKDQELILHRHGRPEQVWMDLDYSPVPGESGRPAGVIAIVVETTQRVLTERRLRESEEQLRLVIDSAQDYAIFTTDPERRITNWSAGAARVFGVTAQEAIGTSADRFWTPEDRAAREPEHEADTARAHGCANDERWHQRADGSRVFLNGSAHPLPRDAEGRERGFIKIARDETQRRAAEAELAAATERNLLLAGEREAILSQLTEGVIVTDREGRIVFVNRRAEELHGVARLDVAPADYAETYHLFTEGGEPYPPEELPLARAVLNGETVRDARWRIRRPDGSEILAIGSAHPFEIGGERAGAVLTLRDDTERHAAEAALRESEERLRLVQTAGEIGSFDYDLKKDEAICSPEYYALLGLPQGHPINRETWQAVIHPDDRQSALDALEQSIAERRPFDFEYRIIRADNGEVRWLSGRATIVFDASGEPWRYVGGNMDMTDRVLAESKLRESEARLSRALEAGRIGDWEWDLDTGKIDWSENLLGILGIPADTPKTADSVFDVLHPDDRPMANAAIERAVKTGEPIDFNFRIIDENGVTRWIASRGRVERDADGRPLRIAGVNYDVTATHAAEEALRETSQQLNAIINNTEMALFMMDDRQQCVFMNKAAEELTGYTFEETQDRSLHDVIHHKYPDGRDYPLEECPIDRAFPADDQVQGEELFVHKDGHFYPVAFTASPIRNQAGEPIGTVIEARNIAEEKARDAALREAEERYRLAARATNDAIWDWDLLANHVLWNEALYAVFGYDKSDVQPTGDWWIEQIHPEDRQRVSDSIHAVIEGAGTNWNGEYRFRRADGSYADIYDRGTVIRDPHGAAVRMIGAMLDQTDIRTAEAALREEGRTLETLNRTGAALAAELDVEALVRMVTDAGVELTGAQFGAFFHNVINEAGESYMLYTLSGAEPSQFDFGMPRATAVFHPTFAGEGVIRSDDITKDARYGLSEPHFGMPQGHLPVRSYLAVPVISRSGEVIGGLFFGHSEPERFTARHEQLMTGIAAQAAIAMDNARLFQAAQRELASRERAEQELRHLNETLEQRVADEVARRAETEEALRQAQKMETLGQLTGGVAHDFNNLLQIVSGNIGLIQRGIPEGNAKLRRAAENAARGAERAAILTQRLLAFARRQPLAPKPTDPNRLVSGMSDLLHRTLGEMIEVETRLTPGLWTVEVDQNQLENAILNLAVNARDAMPGGGKLTIETRNQRLEQDDLARDAGAGAGDYAAILVSDTGLGMDADTVARAFEPFFTTKEVGKGTGLGLSMVYGFVKQSGGHLDIRSELGAGTTVAIYLPRLAGAEANSDEAGAEAEPEGTRGETILVCEDDEDVRAYTVEVLRELGYRVVEAADGPTALRLLEQEDGRVDLLFTDVVLPSGMTGATLAARARAMRPELKVLFTTGYARDAIVHGGRIDPGVELITKPFSYADLAGRVRDLLDGSPGGA